MQIPWRKIWPTALTVALLALALVSGFGTLRSIWTDYRIYRTGTDGPSIWAERMVNLAQALPTGYGIIGYLSERDLPGVAFEPIDQDEEYVMTQYFLAPRVIEEGTNRSLVMANIGNQSVTPADVEAQFHLRLLKNYGWGIALYEQVKP